MFMGGRVERGIVAFGSYSYSYGLRAQESPAYDEQAYVLVIHSPPNSQGVNKTRQRTFTDRTSRYI